MNDKLFELYSSKWHNLCSAVKQINDEDGLEIKPANPLLLQVDKEEDFVMADIRVVIYGQETNGWYGDFIADINPILDCYDKFFNRGECWSYGGQFWLGFSKFWKMLEAKYPEKKIRFIWNNIVKIGKSGDKGFPPDYIYEIERNYFSVVNDELQILKPNLVLFFSGPNYDSIVKDNFGQIKYEALAPYSERWLSQLQIPNVDFAFRTYHPNFLWRNDIESFFRTIIDRTNY
ncbi:MAG: hypothetical protein KA713_00730 [Chryseotalea sp. WA131a]|nr:MAG: hypothetical protein KA713_00730 [Chryseotalea sp. WA131a]